MDKTPLLIVVAGPTAIGKTSLAIELAKQLNTVIISADSRQCYKEMSIGVAKPTVEELNTVEHFFINSHSIHDVVNAGVYEQYSLHVLSQLFQQHQVVVVCGGTGLYIKALCDGVDDMPNIPMYIRQELNNQYTNLGLTWLQHQVQKLDNEFWQKTHEKNNPHRLLRALEVVQATSQSILSFRNSTPKNRPFNILKIGLEVERDILYQRIHHRVDVMLQQGLVDEVVNLLPYQQLQALQTVGYTEIFQYLAGHISLNQAIDDIKKNTRHYAKRQLTWFKKDTSIQWFDIATHSPEAIIETVKNSIDR